jgi:hypothetical protein
VTTSGVHLRELCLGVLQSDDSLRGQVAVTDVEAAFNAELAAQAAVRAAAPQLAALRLAASSLNN